VAAAASAQAASLAQRPGHLLDIAPGESHCSVGWWATVPVLVSRRAGVGW